ncbi:MAG: site-2 protease family protein [Pirellula sp.]|jgi:stage IV sporulation protein FB
MLLSEPQESPYDVRFRLFGFPIRVTWLFWAVIAALGYDRARYLQEAYSLSGIETEFTVILLLWVAAGFLSILIHELGHTLAFRFFGIESHIVLYQMGGLAIPGAGLIWAKHGLRQRLSHSNHLVISAAGPAIQLLLAFVVGGIAVWAGYFVYEFALVANWLGISLGELRVPPNIYLFTFVKFLVSTSIWWALLNLLPILPLDGGQIARHLIGIIGKRDGQYEAACLSVVVAILVAFWFIRQDSWLPAIFLGSFAYNNLQLMQSSGRGSPW